VVSKHLKDPDSMLESQKVIVLGTFCDSNIESGSFRCLLTTYSPSTITFCDSNIESGSFRCLLTTYSPSTITFCDSNIESGSLL
jgi:ribosomal protein L24E